MVDFATLVPPTLVNPSPFRSWKSSPCAEEGVSAPRKRTPDGAQKNNGCLWAYGIYLWITCQVPWSCFRLGVGLRFELQRTHTHSCRGINSCQLQVAVRLDRGSFLRYRRDCRGSSYSTMTVSRICKHSLMRTKQASPDVKPWKIMLQD
jgi:hypothetical protein